MEKTPHMFDTIKKANKKTVQNKKKVRLGGGKELRFCHERKKKKRSWAFQKMVMLLCSFSTALAVERPDCTHHLSANGTPLCAIPAQSLVSV